MTLALALSHLALTVALWAMVRDRLHPAIVFSGIWAIIFFSIAGASEYGYLDITPDGSWLFALGTLVFCAGTLLFRGAGAVAIPDFDYRRLAKISVILHIVLLPLWWRAVSSILDTSDNPAAMAFALRYATTNEGQTLDFFSGNYLIIGLIFTPLLAIGAIRGKLNPLLTTTLIAPWLFTNILTNGRAGSVQLFLSFLYVYIRLSNRTIKLRTLVTTFGIAALLFGAGAILVKKTDADESSQAQEIATAVWSNFVDYAIQGPILMSRVIDHEYRPAVDWDSFFMFKGKRWEHADFNAFDKAGNLGNVYTIYFAQVPIYGVAGSLLIMFAYGLAAGYVHSRSGSSHTMMLLAAYLFGATALSIFTDAFAPSLNYLTKLIIIGSVCSWICRVRPSQSFPPTVHTA